MTRPGIAAPSNSLLQTHVRIIRRRWWVILGAMLLALMGSTAYSMAQEPVYRASADVLLTSTTLDAQGSGTGLSAEEVATQLRVVTSLPVAERVADELATDTVPDLDELVTVEALGSSRVVRVTATAASQAEAARTAETVVRAYLDHRRTTSQESLAEVSAVLNERQRRLERRIDQIDAALDGQTTGAGDLEAERRNLLSQLGQTTSQLSALDIGVGGSSGGSLLVAPETESPPVSPRPVLNGTLSILVGLLAGLGLALLGDRLDTSVREEEDLQSLGPSIAVLGTLPWHNRRGAVRRVEPGSAAEQAYRGLWARLRHHAAPAAAHAPADARSGMLLLCTSAEDTPARSTVGAELAATAARAGSRVILVEEGRSTAQVHHVTGAPGRIAPGLSDVAHGKATLAESLTEGAVEGLFLLPPGSSDDREALPTQPLLATLATAAEEADLVVVQTRPLLASADALELARTADMVLLVVEAGRTRAPMVKQVIDRLLQVDGGPVALVLARRSSDTSARLRDGV